LIPGPDEIPVFPGDAKLHSKDQLRQGGGSGTNFPTGEFAAGFIDKLKTLVYLNYTNQPGEKIIMILIAPSILSADGGRLAEEIAAVEKAGADWIHIDIMDGHFVPNITIGPAIITALRKTTKLPFDVHLMIENPERYIEPFVQAGADIITVHVEAANHLHRTIDQIQKLGRKAGVSLNPATPLTQVEEILPDIDLLLIMTVNPGFGGQQFIKRTLTKIKRAGEIIAKLPQKPILEVDGGVTLSNAASICQAGAQVMVAGNSIFSTADYKKTIAELKAASSGQSDF
jgi:ribulose-phosphate 3-epimerase